MVRIIPRDLKFLDMFVDMTTNLIDGARVLMQTLAEYDPQEVAPNVRHIKEIERQGDEMTHNVLRKLHQTFITPFDREDIHKLASTIDDVLDLVNAAGERLVLYKIENPPPPAAQLAALIVRQTEEIAKAVRLLEKSDGVLAHCVEINRIENEADHVARAAIAKLFEHEENPIYLIKIKELYETLETATDRAEDVANVLEGVVLKGA